MRSVLAVVIIASFILLTQSRDIIWQNNTLLTQNIQLSTNTSIAFYSNATCSLSVSCSLTDFNYYYYNYFNFENMTQGVVYYLSPLLPGISATLQCCCGGDYMMMVFDVCSQSTEMTTYPPIPVATFYSDDYYTYLSWGNEFYYSQIIYNITFTAPEYFTFLTPNNMYVFFNQTIGVPYLFEISSTLKSMKSEVYYGSIIATIPTPYVYGYSSSNVKYLVEWGLQQFSVFQIPSSLRYIVCLDSVYKTSNLIAICSDVNQTSMEYFYNFEYNQNYIVNVTAYTPYARSTASEHTFVTDIAPAKFQITALSHNYTNITWTDENLNKEYLRYYLLCNHPVNISMQVVSPLILKTLEAKTYYCYLETRSSLLYYSYSTHFVFATQGAFVEKVSFSNFTLNSVVLSFIAIPGSNMYDYTVSSPTYSFNNLYFSTGGASEVIELAYLNHSTKYSITIIPNALFETSNPTTFMFSTLPIPPSNISVLVVTDTCAKFLWNSIPNFLENSGPFMYKVCSFDGSCFSSLSSNPVHSNLLPNSINQLKIYNVDSFEKESSAVHYSVSTLPGIINITFTEMTFDRVKLLLVAQGTLSVSYTACIKIINTSSCPTVSVISSISAEIEFTELKSNTNYTISIIASNLVGNSTTTTFITTFSKPPKILEYQINPAFIDNAKFINAYKLRLTPIAGESETDAPASGFYACLMPFSICRYFSAQGVDDIILNPSSLITVQLYSYNIQQQLSRDYLEITIYIPPVSSALELVSGSGNQLDFQFKDYNYNATLPYYYTVCMEDINCKKFESISSNSSFLFVSFTNMIAATQYVFSINCSNSNSTSETNYFGFFTGVPAPSKATVVDFGADYAVFTWIDKITYNASIIEYVITFQKLGSSNLQTVNCAFCSSSFLFGLDSESVYLYSVSVIATTANGVKLDSGLRVTGNFTTLRGFPPSSAPKVVSIDATSDSLLVVLAEIPKQDTGNARISEYVIEYTTSKELFNSAETTIKSISISFTTAEASVIIEDLNAATTYYLRTSAKNVKGISPYSAIVETNTSEDLTAGISSSSNTIAAVLTVVLLILFCILFVICVIGLIIVGIITIVFAKRSKRAKALNPPLQLNIEMREIDNMFQIDYTNLSFADSKVLGTGAQGTVCTAKYKGALVAVKMFPKSAMGVKNDMSCFLSEVKFLSTQCNHSNIIRLIGVAEDTVKHKLCIVTELCSGGNLATFID